MVVKTLRYVAHTNNASLVFTMKDDESLVSKFKGILNFSLFNGRLNKVAVTDYAKPIIVPAGLDQLQHIGTVNVPFYGNYPLTRKGR
jgi:dynein light intermediate chain 2